MFVVFVVLDVSAQQHIAGNFGAHRVFGSGRPPVSSVSVCRHRIYRFWESQPAAKDVREKQQ